MAEVMPTVGPRGTRSLSFLPGLGDLGRKGRKGVVTPSESQPRAPLLPQALKACLFRRSPCFPGFTPFLPSQNNRCTGGGQGARRHRHLPAFGRAASPTQQTPELSLKRSCRSTHRPGAPPTPGNSPGPQDRLGSPGMQKQPPMCAPSSPG